MKSLLRFAFSLAASSDGAFGIGAAPRAALGPICCALASREALGR